MLDAGCGNGAYLHRVRNTFSETTVLGIDIAPRMLAALSAPVACADAAHLPMTDGSVDVVLAMHMIYHLPDIPAGLAEFRRVLRPGGLLITSTNASDDKSELGSLWSHAAASVLRTSTGPKRLALSDRYRLDDAPAVLTNAGFTHTNTWHLEGTITVTTPDPVITHLKSYESFAAETKTPFEPTIEAAQKLLATHLNEHGTFAITSHGGITFGSNGDGLFSRHQGAGDCGRCTHRRRR